jgi:DNA polymerase III subunit gamma/tau
MSDKELFNKEPVPYQVLARKYRPGTFQDLCGQEHIAIPLRNSILRNRIGHAYIFSGLRGVGKTSAARIFAKALNCLNFHQGEPCGECVNCKDITRGASLAVREIDAASYNSVENIREIIESLRSIPPSSCPYKVYLIDEVHMLSNAAFNAMLKSLEEPPPKTIFILATTEPHKIPETVLSRCQHYIFRPITSTKIKERLLQVVNQEKIIVSSEALSTISRIADGSMRDAQSMLDKAISFVEGEINDSDISLLFGVVNREKFFQLSDKILSCDVSHALAIATEIGKMASSATMLLKDFVEYWRDIFLVKFLTQEQLSLRSHLEKSEINRISELVDSCDGNDIQDLFSIARKGCDVAVRSFQPTYCFEALVVQMAGRQKITDFVPLLESLKSLTTSLKSGSSTVGNIATAKLSLAKNVATSKSEIKINFIDSIGWDKFVKYVSESGMLMLYEHLMKTVFKECISSRIVIGCDAFTRNYLEQNSSKILDLLGNMTGRNSSDWSLKMIDEKLPQIKTTKKLEILEKREIPADHPVIKTIQSVFPGSRIVG